MKWKRMKNQRKKVATRHVNTLLQLSLQIMDEHPERARRYIEMTRNIVRKHKVRLSNEQKRQFCKCCNTPLVPGKTCRVRTRNEKVSVTCLNCGNIKRHPFSREKRANRIRSSYFEKKYPGGLVCVELQHDGKVIHSIKISGDFFFYPEEKLASLETEVKGKSFSEIRQTVCSFFESEGIESPGISPEDYAELICIARSSPSRS